MLDFCVSEIFICGIFLLFEYWLDHGPYGQANIANTAVGALTLNRFLSFALCENLQASRNQIWQGPEHLDSIFWHSWVTLLWQAAQCNALQRSATQTCISLLLEKLGRPHCCKQVASRKHTKLFWKKIMVHTLECVVHTLAFFPRKCSEPCSTCRLS